jgi:cyanobactin biosynthesis protein (PatB/AcyB/McaB family)
MSLPPQAPPVHRPSLIDPHRVVEVKDGSVHQLLRARMYLLHGANFNDPAPWAPLLPMRMVVSTLGYR